MADTMTKEESNLVVPELSETIAESYEKLHEEVAKSKCRPYFTERTKSLEVLAFVVLFFLLWAIGFSIFPSYAVPSSGLMRMIFLCVGAQIMGSLVAIFRIPDILGMIVWGVIYTNIGLADFTGYEEFEHILRELALVSAMLLVGLDLDYQDLKKRIMLAVRLIFIPTIAEVIAIAVLAYFLFNMKWIWGILLGLVITPVSPNVVISILLDLKEKSLGAGTGIHSIIIAMSGLGDVFSVFFLSVVFGLMFSTSYFPVHLLQGPLGIAIGVVFGSLMGYLCFHLPPKISNNSDFFRSCLLLGGGTVSVLGCSFLDFPSGGALGCIVMAFFIRTKWGTTDENRVHYYLDLVWTFMKPISFGLIGKELDFFNLDTTYIWQGLVVIIIGLIFRLLTGYFLTSGGDFTWQERAFITVSSIPKGTIQATIGPLVLDFAKKMANPWNENLGTMVLICSVLSIMLTVPLGALLMINLAPRLLTKGTEPHSEVEPCLA